MTFKNTVTLSVFFHVCFFSAALIFSAGFFTGSGEIPDEHIFFVSLSHEDATVPGEEMNDQSSAAPSLPRVVEKKTNPSVVTEEKPPAVKQDAAEEPVLVIEEKSAEMLEPVIDEANEVQLTDGLKHEESNIQAAHEGTDKVNGLHSENVIDSTSDAENMQAAKSSFSPESSAVSGQHGEGLTRRIIDLIGSAIEQVKTYPALARKRGIEGTVQVSFRITLTGEPEEIRIMKSSGFRILDRATLKVVKRAAPYPHLDRRVEVPVAYKLRERG